jgi:hypothetical protein
MRHIDWLNPDNIILTNSKKESVFYEFTNDMMSKKYKNLRLLKDSTIDELFLIRYEIENQMKWYHASLVKENNDLRFFSINLSLYPDNHEIKYKKFDREDKINQLLK